MHFDRETANDTKPRTRYFARPDSCIGGASVLLWRVRVRVRVCARARGCIWVQRHVAAGDHRGQSHDAHARVDCCAVRGERTALAQHTALVMGQLLRCTRASCPAQLGTGTATATDTDAETQRHGQRKDRDRARDRETASLGEKGSISAYSSRRGVDPKMERGGGRERANHHDCHQRLATAGGVCGSPCWVVKRNGSTLLQRVRYSVPTTLQEYICDFLHHQLIGTGRARPHHTSSLPPSLARGTPSALTPQQTSVCHRDDHSFSNNQFTLRSSPLSPPIHQPAGDQKKSLLCPALPRPLPAFPPAHALPLPPWTRATPTPTLPRRMTHSP